MSSSNAQGRRKLPQIPQNDSKSDDTSEIEDSQFEEETDIYDQTYDDEEEELMMTMDGPMRASPTPTIATQPLSDEDSDRGGGAFTSPRTKNVVEILMEMDHRRASIGTTRDEVEGAL